MAGWCRTRNIHNHRHRIICLTRRCGAFCDDIAAIKQEFICLAVFRVDDTETHAIGWHLFGILAYVRRRIPRYINTELLRTGHRSGRFAVRRQRMSGVFRRVTDNLQRVPAAQIIAHFNGRRFRRGRFRTECSKIRHTRVNDHFQQRVAFSDGSELGGVAFAASRTYGRIADGCFGAILAGTALL